ncbi:hypothetical protein ACIBCB_33230 [Streptomyces uncialis]|uniref:hypothetical protein n=1 Tax=Streptomyces uncialis TaxID=1048205 RepID=UPI00379E446A
MSTEEETAASGTPRPRGRNAPRHAAPRKPLLTRLHMPAGKAIAIAAMPTAVLMGMGLTPTLAQARPVVPDNPFQDGPCVTAPDTVPAGKSATEAEEKPGAEAEEKPGAEAGGKSGGKSGTESGEPSGAAATPTPDPATDAPAARSPDARDGDGSRAGKPASGRPEAGKPTGGTTEARGPDAVRTPGRPEPAPAPSPTGDRDRDADEDPDSDRDRDGGSGPGPAPTPSARAREPVTRTSPTPAPARTRLPSHPLDRLNPLDPLGVGRAVEDLLSPLRPRVPAVTGSATPTPTRTPGGHGTGTPERERDDDGDGGDEGEQPDADDEESGTPGTGDPATPTGPAGSAGTTAPDAPDGPAQPDEPTGAATPTPATPSGAPGATPTPTPTGTPGATPTPGPMKSPSAADPMAPDADGKVPFPCVVERKVAGDAERPPAMIPNQPWHLEASSLLLKGLDYQGVVNLTMPNGRTKQALKFVSADGVDIGDLHQIVDAPGGRKYHVQAGRGTISTIRGGTVTMYTERLEGNLFGLIPVVFDPEHPPPLNIPVAYFTQVRIVQAGQFGGDLTIPQLHQSVTG